MVKVLIVDDSLFMRSALAEILGASKQIEVVGLAKNGREGLMMAQSLNPDLITLDVEMPVMDGLSMLKELMATNPKPVIMISSITTESADSTFKALELGALDFLPKYSKSATDDSMKTYKESVCEKVIEVSKRGSFLKTILKKTQTVPAKHESVKNKMSAAGSVNLKPGVQARKIKKSPSTSGTAFEPVPTTQQKHFISTERLAEKRKLLAKQKKGDFFSKNTNKKDEINPKPLATQAKSDIKTETKTDLSPVSPVISVPASSSKIKYIGIGVSTGGPPAIQKLLCSLPANFPASILIAQHMPAAFTKAFATRLDGLCAIKVKEAENGEIPKPGTAYIAQGGQHISLVEKSGTVQICMSTEPSDELYKPSADILFKSLVPFASKSVGVIMTGMGHDGLKGLKLFKANKGKVIAQNEDSCVVYGMPKAVIEAGCADEVKDLDHMAQAILTSLY